MTPIFLRNASLRLPTPTKRNPNIGRKARSSLTTFLPWFSASTHLDIFDNPEEVLKVKTEVDDLDQETSESLVEFIDTERKTLEIAYGYKIVKSQTTDNLIDLLRWNKQ